jgi:uncharacterized protein YutE (UPF0331/DUF86 family)
MVDTNLIQRKIILLENYKRGINSFSIKNFNDFQKKFAVQKAVEKILEEMIQVCIDIAKHLIADEKMLIPDENTGLFKVLYENKIISLKTSEIMKKMVGFRNILVHMYEKIDIETVYDVYKKRLGDFDLFAKEIEKYIDKR